MDISKGSKLVESIKSILLVVLFLLTILLLYFFWSDTALRNLIGEEHQRRAAISPVEIFQPDRIEISFGGDTYTVFSETEETSEKFHVIMDCFKTFAEGRSLSAEEISKELYEERVRRASIKAVFEYFIPFSAICELYEIDRIPGADAIFAVSELAYSADFDDCLFVYDNRVEKYYRIAGTVNNCFDNLKQEIENAEREFLYFTLGNYMGGEINNNTLWPISFESNLYDIEYSREDFPGQPERVNDIVRSFFSDSFDFVRRIADENGTVIYMYGYGRIVVVAHNNGVLEYMREEDGRAVQPRYLEAFETANAFIAAHGGFSAISGMTFEPYIKEVIVNPEDKRGYRFIFGIKASGGRVYYQTGAPMIVDVLDGRVSYFKRQLINISPNETRTAESDSRQVFLPVINLIAFNTEYIGAALVQTQTINAEDIFSDTLLEVILEKVERLDSGYIKINADEHTLQAAWIVTIGGLEFYFGLDDGEPLGYYQQ